MVFVFLAFIMIPVSFARFFISVRVISKSKVGARNAMSSEYAATDLNHIYLKIIIYNTATTLKEYKYN